MYCQATVNNLCEVWILCTTYEVLSVTGNESVMSYGCGTLCNSVYSFEFAQSYFRPIQT